jgi:hypothetical protein
MAETGWGVVSTVKASSETILTFAAHHLELGAQRVHIYLDDDAVTAREALIGHPKCRVILCDDGYWRRRFKRGGRPGKHQQRQSANATHCYRRRAEVEWLAHIDVDEFLWPGKPLSEQLSSLPKGTLSARVRPVEALAADRGDPPSPGVIYCKATALPRRLRARQTTAIFPTYGAHLNGGFLSHVAGKVFVRTGEEAVSLRIHNAFRNGVMDEHPAELPATELAHLHAPSWEAFLAAYRFRLECGSYRSELKPASGDGGLTMHQLFSMLEAEGGERALRAFYDEVCVASPDLRARLEANGLLRRFRFDARQLLLRHFPETIID